MRRGPGCAVGKRTLRLGKMKKSLQVPESEGSRVGQLTVDGAQSGHRGSRGGTTSPRAQRRKRPRGLEDRAQPALEE